MFSSTIHDLTSPRKLSRFPEPGMIFLPLSLPYVQLESSWLPSRYESHHCTFRSILQSWSLWFIGLPCCGLEERRHDKKFSWHPFQLYHGSKHEGKEAIWGIQLTIAALSGILLQAQKGPWVRGTQLIREALEVIIYIRVNPESLGDESLHRSGDRVWMGTLKGSGDGRRLFWVIYICAGSFGVQVHADMEKSLQAGLISHRYIDVVLVIIEIWKCFCTNWEITGPTSISNKIIV